ncbi:hypothetical protein KKD49_18645 [Myxococcota bacterium]|nr:hypothetical protein [Myxococcota bacterium]
MQATVKKAGVKEKSFLLYRDDSCPFYVNVGYYFVYAIEKRRIFRVRKNACN